jgi:chromosome segregation ATPase
MTNTSITAAAHAVAEAERRVEGAAAKLNAARERVDLIDGRIADLDAARTDMIERRARGEAREDDAAMLALNAADREGLVAMRAEAVANEAAAREPQDAAVRALDTARVVLARAEAEATEGALVARAAHLDSLMLRTVAELNAVGRRLDRGRPAWVPSAELRDTFRTLAVHAGAL